MQSAGSSGSRVAFLTTPYFGGQEQPDGEPWPQDDPQRVDRFNELLRTVAGRHPDVVTVIDLSGLLGPGRQFASVVDGVAARTSDGIHISKAGGEWLAPRLVPALVGWATHTP